jgi:hypothetical protein
MNTDALLNGLSNEVNSINKVAGKIFTPQLIQLHPNIEGFKSPDTYGVYKNTGGEPLGVVGKTFKPMDLKIMLDSIVTSTLECGKDIDLNTLDFKEYKGGSKVAFTLDLPTLEIKGSPMVGDIISRKIEFRTGFDGKTKSSVVESFERLWCANGCTSTVSQNVAFKNTIGNHAKIYNLCNYITQSIANSENFVTNIGKLSEIEVSQKEIDLFLTKLTGYNVKEYKDLHKITRNVLDSINANIAIEAKNTGFNMFSIVNGITRYNTHEVANQDEEKLFYSSAQTMNNNALNLAFAELN